MTPKRPLFALLALLAPLAALCAAGPSHAAWPITPDVPYTLPLAADDGGALADGAGGVYVAGTGTGVAGQTVAIVRLAADGSPAPGWAVSGLVLADFANTRDHVRIVSDGSGGVFVAWNDARAAAGSNDIYVQHVLANGTVAPGWTAGGVRVSTNTANEDSPSIVSDRAGGVFVAWNLYFSGPDVDVYAGHVGAAGTVLWSHSVKSTSFFEGQPTCLYIAGRNDLGIVYQFKILPSGNYDVKATFLTAAGAADWDTDVIVSVGDQYLLTAVQGSDDHWYALWRDGRSANYTVYARLYDGLSAVLQSPWPFSDGLPVADDGTYQYGAVAAVDSTGALWTAITSVGIYNDDILLQRLLPSGVPAPGWASGGSYVCTAPFAQAVVAMVIDGAQNAVVEWTDRRSGSPTQNDMYVTRVRPDGGLAPGFSYNGQPLAIRAGAQQNPGFAAADPAGGAFLGWSGSEMAHVDRFGALGDVSPRLTSVRDVAGDQGGAVRLQWNAAPYDAEPVASIATYWVWRSTPLALAQQAVANGARWLEPGATDADVPAAAAGSGLYMPDENATSGYAWEYLASMPASLFPTYSYVAATTGDSTASGSRNTAFLVQARSNTSGVFWSSAPDSGHSVDNLAPAAPSPFSGLYSGGSASLVWGAPGDPDVATYRLYRGTNPAFVPGPASFVTETASLASVDAAGQPYWYKVAAVDVHGNVGPYATTLPLGALASPGEELPTEVALAPLGANPWRGGAMSLRFDLPRAARASLAVFDVSGRLVRTLAGGDLPAGRHLAAWDGADANGHALPNGIYLVRLSTDERQITRRVTRLR